MFSSLLSMSGFETINNKRNSYKKELISCVSSNTLKTINSFRTLPLIKSKSFSSCSRSSVTESSEAAMNNNSGRRRLSWLERRKSWTFKRTGMTNEWPFTAFIAFLERCDYRFFGSQRTQIFINYDNRTVFCLNYQNSNNNGIEENFNLIVMPEHDSRRAVFGSFIDLSI